jgi:hypothetical protein
VFSRTDWIVIATVGGLLTVLAVSAYVRGVREGSDVGHGRAVALAVLTLASAFVTVVLGRLRTIAGIVVPAATIVASVILIEVPIAARALGLSRLHADDWTVAAAGAALAAAMAAAGTPGHRRPAWGPRDRGRDLGGCC